MTVHLLSASEAFELLEQGLHAFIDVRSEGEFCQASIPGCHNAPILNDDERHRVGLTYKREGQEAAIALGHKLVDPQRPERVKNWQMLAGKYPKTPVVLCWRGGLRSAIAASWLEATGNDVLRVKGGYKAMRQELLPLLENPPKLLIIAGLTGSGKTRLLWDLPIKAKLDLEGLACHRGSSFGGFHKKPQPAQAIFENAIGLGLRRAGDRVVVEDESVAIGSIHLPPALRRAIVGTPVVYLATSPEERAANIYDEYIIEPLKEGISKDVLKESLMNSVKKLAKRLGGVLTAQTLKDIAEAFQNEDAALHRQWIKTLLTEYYDKSYSYAFARTNRDIIFQGNYQECRQWILNQFA